jgi:hypothetical protein
MPEPFGVNGIQVGSQGDAVQLILKSVGMALGEPQPTVPQILM